MAEKPSLGDRALVQRFLDYKHRAGNSAWGSLHIVLDDGNVGDQSVAFCREWAYTNSDEEGLELATTLFEMSRTQRLKLPEKVRELEREQSHG